MDAAREQALRDFLRVAFADELNKLANLEAELQDLHADVEVLAAQVGWRVTEHQEKEIARLHRLGLSANIISLITGRAITTVRERVQRVPPPPRTLGADGRSRAHPRAS